MGALCNAIGRGGLNPDEILKNINNLFKGMLIRSIPIDQIASGIKDLATNGQLTNPEAWKNMIADNIANSQFAQTSKELVTYAMDDARNNYGDATLPLLSLLFLAGSTKEQFVTAFKAISLAKRAQGVGNDVKNVANAGKKGFFAGIKAGLGALKNLGSAAKQAVNPNSIRKSELRTLMSYHINFLTLLPVNLLAQFNEGVKMKGYFVTVLNNAFNKDLQNQFVDEKLFVNYYNVDEINVDEFYDLNYDTLKDDMGLRKGLVTQYIKNLSPQDIMNLISSA